MLKPGDVLDLGPLGARFHIKQTAAETAGQSFDMEWELAPRTGGTPVHIHPLATETYEILEGQLDLYVSSKWRTLTTGQQLTVEAGVPHTFRNSSSEVTRVYNKHQPAMRYDEYFEGLRRITSRGIVSARGMSFKAILHLAVLMTSYREEIVSIRPPDLIMRVLGRLGRLLGYQI